MGCHQATVSRRLACCRESFAIAMGRHEGEWECNITPLLALERHVHQTARWPVGPRALARAAPDACAGQKCLRPSVRGRCEG